MPAMDLPQRDHLHRLTRVWVRDPVYFLTTCTQGRRPILTAPAVVALLVRSWQDALPVHGWIVGRYVILPDHVHFFARAGPAAKPLAAFMRDWKKWTARQISAVDPLPAPIWQPEFFDHVLRSAASYGEKWSYVRENPVRAGLVARAEDWPHAGECEHLTFQ